MPHQAFEQCGSGHPRSSDSLTSMCWPITRQSNAMAMHVVDAGALSAHPPRREVSWPVAEPWRRNLSQPGCESEGRCQGDAMRCNSKYRYGVDDVGACPSSTSCKSGFLCTPGNQPCENPCDDVAPGHRRTTRCFEWPQPRRNLCPVADTNTDFQPPRAHLNVEDNQPERCPTCKRTVVDMQCGPLGYNY